HPADWALARLVLMNLRMHDAGVVEGLGLLRLGLLLQLLRSFLHLFGSFFHLLGDLLLFLLNLGRSWRVFRCLRFHLAVTHLLSAFRRLLCPTQLGLNSESCLVMREHIG